MNRAGVAFRAGAGPAVGLGHLRRCVTLAQELQTQGIGSHFAIDPDPTAMTFLRRHGFEGIEERDERDLARTLEIVERWGARALVVDSYAIAGERLALVKGPIVAVIDDLADRPLLIDLVVNGSANAGALAYRTSAQTRLLLGPEYILLREEFSREPRRVARSRIECVLITVGGTDRFHLTPRLIEWTQKGLGPVAMEVVIGPFFTQDSIEAIERLAEKMEGAVRLHRDPPDMRVLMMACDLAIAGGGQTTYELAATGTPAVAIRLADNQTGNLSGLAAKGTLVWVGDANKESLGDKVVKALARLAGQPNARQAMGCTGRLVVDGLGAKRVARALIALAGFTQEAAHARS